MGYRAITHTEAAQYFAHPNCRIGGDDDAQLEAWMDFRAVGPVCGGFHRHLWPGVWMGHFGCLREAWGRTAGPMREIMAKYAAEVGAERICGWISGDNRAMLGLAKRAGMELDGVLPMQPPVVLVGWGP